MRGRQIHPDPPHLLTIAVTCFVLFLIGLTVFLSVGCSSSNLGKSLNVGVVASSAADLVTTHHAIDRGGREANPVMGQSDLQRLLVKSLGVGVILAGSQAIEKSHPVIAHVLRSVAIVGFSAVALHNAGVKR